VLGRDPRAREADRALHADGGSRRWTSAAVVAASIVAAAPSATSENATSSAMTIPAAESMSTRTPLRVTKRTPDLRARRARLLEQHVDAAGRRPRSAPGRRARAGRLALDPRARDVDARAEASGKATLSGATAIPRPAAPRAPDLDLVADADVPRVGHAALDRRLVRRRRRRGRRRSRSRGGPSTSSTRPCSDEPPPAPATPVDLERYARRRRWAARARSRRSRARDSRGSAR
jgi:hypothetical protein